MRSSKPPIDTSRNFSPNVSHELRTPLNSIIGFTRIVLRRSEGKIEALQKGKPAESSYQLGSSAQIDQRAARLGEDRIRPHGSLRGDIQGRGYYPHRHDHGRADVKGRPGKIGDRHRAGYTADEDGPRQAQTVRSQSPQ